MSPAFKRRSGSTCRPFLCGTIRVGISCWRAARYPAIPGRVGDRMVGGCLRPEIPERPLTTELAGRCGSLLAPASRLLALELERQAGDDEECEKDRQKPLSSASVDDGLAFGGVESLGSAGVSAIANLHGVMSRFDWYLDRGVHFERSGTLTYRSRQRLPLTTREAIPCAWTFHSVSAVEGLGGTPRGWDEPRRWKWHSGDV